MRKGEDGRQYLPEFSVPVSHGSPWGYKHGAGKKDREVIIEQESRSSEAVTHYRLKINQKSRKSNG